MIVREWEDSFVMIEQHHHAAISGQLYEHLLLNFRLTEKDERLAVQEAIYLHDIGWKPFDVSPFWNDEKDMPYNFITYPNSIKTVLYRQGIDIVADTNNYAALLCSEHYLRFLKKDSTDFAEDFIEYERERQQQIIASYRSFNQENFLSHYEILQFFDNLSLYICLHEPNTTEDNTHYFFKKGIPLPSLYGKGNLQLSYKGHDLVLDRSLFHESQTIHLNQKVVSKERIKQKGLKKAWEDTAVDVVQITII